MLNFLLPLFFLIPFLQDEVICLQSNRYEIFETIEFLTIDSKKYCVTKKVNSDDKSTFRKINSEGKYLNVYTHLNHSEVQFLFSPLKTGVYNFTITPDDISENYGFTLLEINNLQILTGLRTENGHLDAENYRTERYPVSTDTLKETVTYISQCYFNKTGLISIRGTQKNSKINDIMAPAPFDSAYSFVKPVKLTKGKFYLLRVGVVLGSKTQSAPFKIQFDAELASFSNKKIIIENIHFQTGKAVLLPESFTALDKLVFQLQNNSNMQIALVGHTDNSGDEKENKLLSENRAKAVYNYLISKGIDKSRLQFKGYGSKQSLVPNVNEENKAKNRRVEMVILKE